MPSHETVSVLSDAWVDLKTYPSEIKLLHSNSFKTVCKYKKMSVKKYAGIVLQHSRDMHQSTLPCFNRYMFPLGKCKQHFHVQLLYASQTVLVHTLCKKVTPKRVTGCWPQSRQNDNTSKNKNGMSKVILSIIIDCYASDQH